MKRILQLFLVEKIIVLHLQVLSLIHFYSTIIFWKISEYFQVFIYSNYWKFQTIFCSPIIHFKNQIHIILEEHQIYSWGYNYYGQLGIGNTENKNIPQLISSLINKKIIDIKCGGFHTIALSGEFPLYFTSNFIILFISF